MKVILALVLLLAVVYTANLEAHDVRVKSHKFTLKFDYAAKEGKPLATSRFGVTWNGKKLVEMTPKDYYVNALTFHVEAKVGENILDFYGDGPEDGNGAGIDNVELFRAGKCGKDDVLVNGDFNEGYRTKMGVVIFYEGIPGWKGDAIEVGPGLRHNKNWPHLNPVAELDADYENVDMYQSIVFDKQFEQVSDEQT